MLDLTNVLGPTGEEANWLAVSAGGGSVKSKDGGSFRVCSPGLTRVTRYAWSDA